MSDGARVQRVTTSIPKRINHKLHFWLTVFTGGAWGFVWLALAIIKPKRTITATTTVENYPI